MSQKILEEAFHRVDFDRDLVFHFFITFSLFEKALKELGFRQNSRNDCFQPDWESYAATIDSQFMTILISPNHQELVAAVSYLLNQPPKKQVLRNDQIQFVQTNRPPGLLDTVWLSILIRRVRNNLFHGGKFSYERPRDTFLIQFSLIILEEWANLNPDVKSALQKVR